MCLVISAWLKFVPARPDPLADPPAVQHWEAAVTMTAILSLGIVYFCYISVRWARGSKRMIAEVNRMSPILLDYHGWGWAGGGGGVLAPFELAPVPRRLLQSMSET